MADIATLGIRVDTNQVKTGSRDLDGLTKAGTRAEQAVTNLSSSFSLIKRAIIALGVGYVAKQFIETADAMTLLDARLRLVTESTQEFNEARARLIELSAENRSALAENITLYTKLAPSVKEAGGGIAETTAIVDAFSKTLKISGANTAEAAASTLQFAQAMASGKLSGDEFRSMAETSPRFMKALAESMGLPVGKLKELAKEGRLTADLVGNALIEQRDKLAREFATLPVTVGDQMQLIKNEISLAVNDINKGANITLSVGGVLASMRELIPLVRDELKSAAMSVAGWFEENSQSLKDMASLAGDLIGQLWELSKAAFSVLGFIGEIVAKSEILQFSLFAIRGVVAGIQDGLKIVAAVFAKIGQVVLGFVANWFENVGKAASFVGLSFGQQFQNVAKDMRGMAANAGKAADQIIKDFGEGKTAIGNMANGVEELDTSIAKTAKSSEKLRKLRSLAGAEGEEQSKKEAKAVASLTKQIEELGLAELSRAQRLQLQLDALASINPMERERLQILLNQARAMEVLEAFNESVEIGDKNAAEMAEKESDDSSAAEKVRTDGFTSIYQELERENEDLNAKMLGSDKERIAEQMRLEHERSVQRINELGLETEQAQMLIEQEGKNYKLRLEEAAKNSKETAGAITEFWKEAARNMQDAMSDFFFDAMQGKLGNLEQSFKSTIDRMVANLMASQLSDFLFGATFGKDGKIGGKIGEIFGGAGDFFGDLFGGFFAAGGNPPMGKVSVVGENGPELFVPKSSGTIIPNKQIQQGAPIINMTVYANDANSFNKSRPQMMRDMQRELSFGRRVS